MEEGVAQRRTLASEYPMSRISQTLSRETWSTGLLEEAVIRLKDPNQAYRSSALLKSVADRWTDLPAGKQAKTLLQEQEGNEEGLWHKQREAEIRLIAQLQAEGMQKLATSPARSFVRNQQGAIALEAAARGQDNRGGRTPSDCPKY